MFIEEVKADLVVIVLATLLTAVICGLMYLGYKITLPKDQKKE